MARRRPSALALTLGLASVVACAENEAEPETTPGEHTSTAAAGDTPDARVDTPGPAGDDASTPPSSPDSAMMEGPGAPGVVTDFACEVELMPGVCAWAWGTRSDAAFEVAVDSTGAVLVCGRAPSTAGGSDYDAIAHKYVGGKLDWNTQWGVPNSREVSQALALASGDGLYVTGVMEEDPTDDTWSEDTMLTKLDSEGRVLWTRHFGTTGFHDRGEAVAVDRQGRAHVLSTEFPDDVGRVALRKYGPDDAMLWAVDWSAPGGGTGDGLALDRAGNSYVVGTQTAQVDAESDAYLSKHMPDGSEAWTVQWGDPARPDSATAVAVAEDAIYVTGTTWENLTGDQPDGGTYLMRFTLDGERQWSSQWGKGGGVDVARAITVGPDGRVYVSGSLAQDIPFGGHDTYVGIFDATGEELWRLVLEGLGNPGSLVIVDGITYQTRDDTFATSIALDAGGNIFVAGEGTLTEPMDPVNKTGAFLLRIEAPEAR